MAAVKLENWSRYQKPSNYYQQTRRLHPTCNATQWINARIKDEKCISMAARTGTTRDAPCPYREANQAVKQNAMPNKKHLRALPKRLEYRGPGDLRTSERGLGM